MKDINHTESDDIEQLILRIVNISLIIESIEKELKKQGVPAYDLNELVTDVDGTEKSMGDLHKDRLRAQLDLKEKLLKHKTVPYVYCGDRNFIAKVAAAILDNTDLLEEHLRTEFDDRIDDMVKRYRELSLFFVKGKPRQLVINRLREATECYVYGLFQGCAILCRSTLETALREKYEQKLGCRPDDRKTLGPLLDDAIKCGIISEINSDLAYKIKSIGDEAAHDLRRCSSSEAFESLDKTKLLLNILYQ